MPRGHPHPHAGVVQSKMYRARNAAWGGFLPETFRLLQEVC